MAPTSTELLVWLADVKILQKQETRESRFSQCGTLLRFVA